VTLAVTALAFSGLLATSGCNNTSTPNSGTNPVGTFVRKPGSQESFFIVDPSAAGLSPELRLTQTYFGRLVRVIGFDAQGLRVTTNENYVINPTDLGDGSDYIVETNQITGDQNLVVFRNIDNEAQLAQFRQIVKALGDNLRVVSDSGFVGFGAYTMVPRNAALVFQFSDLIDPSTLSDQSVKVLTGVPSVVPFESRLLLDPNHGDLAEFNGVGGPEFYSTRVIVDPTVSATESFSTNPVLPVNMTGFPASVDQLLSNLQVRFPTRRTSQSTNLLLQNPSAHSLSESGNGSIDFGSPTRDLVRAARAGGRTGVTGDPYNGYLRDDSPPRIVASLDLEINMPPQQSPSDPFEFLLPQSTFVSAFCAQAPQQGDIFAQAGLFAEVLEDATVQPNGQLFNLRIRLLVLPASFQGDPGQFVTSGTTPGQFLVPFDPVVDAARAICFLELTPAATGFPNNPGTGLLPNTTCTVRFNEPVDPGSISIFDTFGIQRRENPAEAIDYVPGTLQRSVDLQQFTFIPELPLAHVLGSSETYYLRIDTRQFAPSDLAGNALQSAVFNRPIINEPVTIASNAATARTGGRVILFASPDEEAPRDNDPGDPTPNLVELLPEFNGEHVYELGRQLIRPRPPIRTQIVGDRAQNTLPGRMTQQVAGQNLPLNTFGAKTQILYRYVDFALPFKIDNRIDANIDRTLLDVDIEGVAFAPLGNVIFESYPRFRMSMAHAAFLPDETINPITGAIVLPQSGLTNIFDNNYLTIVNDPPQVVHQDFLGYQVIPGDRFQTAGGTTLLPLPFNRGPTKRYYTWRDTLIRERGGASGGGVDMPAWEQLTGAPTPIFPGGMPPDCNLPPLGGACVNRFYSPGNVQTAGLPLLIEFDVFPTSGALTQNTFDTSMAHPTQLVPYFRAFSAGGFDTQGNQVIVDPDLETVANGGFNPPGTPGLDNTYYIGALDLVVRVNRSASLFYPVINPLLSDGNPLTRDDPRFVNPVFRPAVLNPRAEDQPLGTTVDVRYRGALVITENHRARVDATQMDPYGDFYPDRETQNANMFPVCDGSLSHDPIRCNGDVLQNEGITFLTDDRWQTNAAALNGAQFIQVHLTMTSNVQSGLSPSIESLALSWSE